MLYRTAAFVALAIFATVLFTGCDDAPPYNGPGLPAGYKKYEREKLPQVEIVTSAGTIKAELFEDDAPLAVDNFVELAEKDFFNGKTFFRIDKDFMICAGDPMGNETDGKRYHFRNDFTKDKNKHVQYALTIDNSYSTAQFCIVTSPKGLAFKDTQATVIGKVTEGKEIVDKINSWTVKGQTPEPPIPITAVKFSYKRNRTYKLEESDKEKAQEGQPGMTMPPASFNVPTGSHSPADLERMKQEAIRKAQMQAAPPVPNPNKATEPVKPLDAKQPDPTKAPGSTTPPPVKPADPTKPAEQPKPGDPAKPATPADTKKAPDPTNPAPK